MRGAWGGRGARDRRLAIQPGERQRSRSRVRQLLSGLVSSYARAFARPRRPLVACVCAALLALSSWSVASASERVYVVQPGDSISVIAERHGVSERDLRAWNSLDGDLIRVGQRLVIRGGRAPAAAASSSNSFLVPLPRERGGRVHTVRSGETLGGIAQRYGVRVQDLINWNQGLQADRIRVGQEIRVGASFVRQRRTLRHEVQPGEMLGFIAQRYGVRQADIVRWNPGLNPDRLRVGQVLVLQVDGPEEPSESRGAAFEGRLVRGEQLPPHRGYQIRNRSRAWGTNETISYLMEGFDAVLRRFPRSPRVMIHDLSFERGGSMPPHRSHQSGRDADIGYYQRSCGEVCTYRRIGPAELDVERQWTLLLFWIEHGMVDYVFIDYELQGALYRFLQAQGASQAQLSRWLQYPRGRGASVGVIRHEPGHRDHLHVRFSCSTDDDQCR